MIRLPTTFLAASLRVRKPIGPEQRRMHAISRLLFDGRQQKDEKNAVLEKKKITTATMDQAATKPSAVYVLSQPSTAAFDRRKVKTSTEKPKPRLVTISMIVVPLLPAEEWSTQSGWSEAPLTEYRISTQPERVCTRKPSTKKRARPVHPRQTASSQKLVLRGVKTRAELPKRRSEKTTHPMLV